MAVLAPPLDQKRRDIASGLEQGGTDGIQNHTQQKRNNHHAARNLFARFLKIFIVYPPKNVTISTIWKD